MKMTEEVSRLSCVDGYPYTEGGIGDKARIDERIIQRLKWVCRVSPVDAPSRTSNGI
jgi:hypothetical protein